MVVWEDRGVLKPPKPPTVHATGLLNYLAISAHFWPQRSYTLDLWFDILQVLTFLLCFCGLILFTGRCQGIYTIWGGILNYSISAHFWPQRNYTLDLWFDILQVDLPNHLLSEPTFASAGGINYNLVVLN